MSGNARPLHAARGEGDSLRNPVATAGPLEIKARGKETGGMLTACESVTMPGEGPPFHKHANEDEVMYFVDGAFRLRIEDEVMEMAPGSFAFVPRDTPHSWQNVSEGQAHMLFVFTPASPGMERFFERLAKVASDEIGCERGLHGARGRSGHDRPRPSPGAVAPDLTWCRSLGTSRILVPKSACIRAHPDTSDPAIHAYSCLRTPRFAIRRSAVRARLAP